MCVGHRTDVLSLNNSIKIPDICYTINVEFSFGIPYANFIKPGLNLFKRYET